MSPTYLPEWDLVIAAIEAGDDAGDALGVEHLERAQDIRVNPDESVTFRVERHPHLLGRPSKGQSYENVQVALSYRNQGRGPREPRH